MSLHRRVSVNEVASLTPSGYHYKLDRFRGNGDAKSRILAECSGHGTIPAPTPR
jgi:hypothetical protein